MLPNGIAYQNKDIASKVFAEKFRDISLNVYGVKLPRIVKVLPTNLPEISANELRIDNLFLLEDGRIAIIDYESEYKQHNHLKYIGYIYRVLERYYGEGVTDLRIVMIVIYTADVTRAKVSESLNAGAFILNEEAVFLSELPSDEIKARLEAKVKAEAELDEEEIMEFIILPLSYKKKQQKEAIKNAITMAKKIKNEETMVFVLAGILVFSDKIIDEELSKKTKEWIAMTKVGRLFEEEAQQREQIAAQIAGQMADAKRLVNAITNIISKGYDVNAACDLVGATPNEFEKAKALLESSEGVA